MNNRSDLEDKVYQVGGEAASVGDLAVPTLVAEPTSSCYLAGEARKADQFQLCQEKQQVPKLEMRNQLVCGAKYQVLTLRRMTSESTCRK